MVLSKVTMELTEGHSISVTVEQEEASAMLRAFQRDQRCKVIHDVDGSMVCINLNCIVFMTVEPAGEMKNEWSD